MQAAPMGLLAAFVGLASSIAVILQGLAANTARLALGQRKFEQRGRGRQRIELVGIVGQQSAHRMRELAVTIA